MDLKNIETFLCVAENHSFSRSAKCLGLTQPAISKRIAALEQELSVQLFDRIGRSPTLTAAGEKLFPQAKHLHAEARMVVESFAVGGAELTGSLTVGTTGYVATGKLLPTLKQFQNTHSEVNLDLKLASIEEILKLVDTNLLDLAICALFDSYQTEVPESLQQIEIYSAKAKIVVATDHPLAHASNLRIQDLLETNAVLPAKDSLTNKAITHIITQGLTELNVVARTNEITALSSLAAINMGWTCLPDSMINNTHTVLEIQGLNLNHTISLFHRRDKSLSRAAEEFINSLPRLNHE